MVGELSMSDFVTVGIQLLKSLNVYFTVYREKTITLSYNLGENLLPKL